MVVENGKIERSFCLTEELELHGMATRDVTVAANGVLHLHGMISGNLAVEAGGRAFVHGTVVGAVINNGGYIEIEGSVGQIVENGGNTRVSASAHVSGRR
jgi:hypothetical protein